jgi:FKBP-type peptidyl-prolyl cis-trans isomerase FklB
MKKVMTLALAVAIAGVSVGQDKKPSKAKLKTMSDSLGYAFAISVGENIKTQSPYDISVDGFIDGIKDYFDDNELKMNAEVSQKFIGETINRKKQEEGKLKSKVGVAFLEANKKKDGVVVTASGLQYKVLKEGTGVKPEITDKVTVHYTGRLIDGKVFDSSVERGQPATFPVNGVIRGWVEALQLMPTGSKWELYIPYELAYQERGTRGIPPYSMLIFEVELLKIGE